MMRPYDKHAQFRTTSDSIYPRRRIQAVLEVIVPQVYEGDHATTAEILHTGSQDSLAVELIRLFIYLEANHMADKFSEITGCNANLSASANVMDFLRGTGFLTKANINLLARSTDSTSQALLERLLLHSMDDENSFDVLGWLVPCHIDVNNWQLGQNRMVGSPGRDGFILCNSSTLLQAASLAGNIRAVRFLLDSGAEPFAKSRGLRCSPLEIAAGLADHDRAYIIADLLLSKQTRSSPEFRMAALEDALEVAIARARAELIVRLLSERKPLGRETIYSEWFTIAAKYADCHTMRLLADNASHKDDGRVELPKDILFSALKRDPHGDPERPLNLVNCVLELGADTAVCRCRHGCGPKCFSEYLEAFLESKDGSENCALNLAKVWRTHGCPWPFKWEMPNSAAEGDENGQWITFHLARYNRYPLLVEYLQDWSKDTDREQDDVESRASECDDDSMHIQISERVSDYHGDPPLFTSLRRGEIEIAKMLLRRYANLRLSGGELLLAIEACDDTELVAMLLQAGSADVDGWEDFVEQTISRQNRECTRMLVSNYELHTTVDLEIVLRAAILTEDQDTIFQQIAVCNYNSRALFDAVVLLHGSKTYHEIVDRLLENRPNTANDDLEVLTVAFAAVLQDMRLMGGLMRRLSQGPWNSVFLDIGYDKLNSETFVGWVNDHALYQHHGQHILSFAADLSKHPEYSRVLDTLLSFNVPAKGMNIGAGDELTVETWKHLIRAGADPNLGLLGAVQDNMLAHVEVLCQAGVLLGKMHLSSHGSRTAVQEAVERGSPEMLEMLLRYGADIDHPAGYFHGATCLQLAAGAGNIGLVRFLLKQGTKVNAKRALIYGRTAVEIAAEHGRLDVVKLLLLQQEHLFQSAAKRHQFIRAAKFAETKGHGVIGTMLKQHIGWNRNDQKTFEALPTDKRREYLVDEMTQELLGSQKRGRLFWDRMKDMSSHLGFDNIYGMEGIEQWIGPPNKAYYDYLAADSEREQNNHLGENSAAWLERNERDDGGGPTGDTENPAELRSDMDQHAALKRVCGGIDDATLDSGSFHGYVIDEEPVNQPHALSLNPGWGGSATALAPRAIRYEVPAWLDDMQDNGRGIQDVTYDLPLQGNTWEALVHRPATRNVNQELGMVIGEVLDEVQHINTTGDDAVDHNNVEDMGDAGNMHVQHFNWGFWDDETFALHSGSLEYLGNARESAG